MSKWLAIVGIGEDGFDALPPAAKATIAAAQTLVGGKRHLAFVPPSQAERIEWRSPLEATIGDIQARRGTRVVVLASGDPMWFGAGATLLRHVPADETLVLPHVSAFALAASALGWPLADATTLTLHGRPIESLALHLAPGAKLLALTSDGEAPGDIARLLAARGFGASRVAVLERLGGPSAKRIDATAETFPPGPFDGLNTLAIDCVAGPDARLWSRVASLPDDAFEHDGQLTKREVRAATLAALAPLPGQLLWDVGAGNGSIAIEWLRAAERACAIAVERDPARLARIARNAAALGVPALTIVAGAAPDALEGLAAPDAIFLGGGLTTPGLVDAAWNALKPRGMFVSNAVTLEGEAILAQLHARHGGEMARIAVARAEDVGPHRGWRPAMQVTQWAARKP